MSFKTDYQKYCKAQEMAREAMNGISAFFEKFDLKYSITYCEGDGEMLLDHEASLCALLSVKDIDDLSKAKTREDVLKVINRLHFYM